MDDELISFLILFYENINTGLDLSTQQNIQLYAYLTIVPKLAINQIAKIYSGYSVWPIESVPCNKSQNLSAKTTLLLKIMCLVEANILNLKIILIPHWVIKSDMPQGSILGRLLDLNDIGRLSICLIFFSFADDTTVNISHYDLNTLYASTNKTKIFIWMVLCQ